ncbi:MAG: lysophospholipid acyltransferase family protein [Candidatus Omnitrophica bacterium]|nr:lysophospholipid acyltransferase family protein [Candidatus Omnitrophota bacterium]MDD5311242.1 lysophospholipid acyltransferase family protein [Candidatus Omnitrophota bacterium]MDD5545725.1 lysophospholipid acyltransferase family protein [Candidatus Omnitrophota bacterium]
MICRIFFCLKVKGVENIPAEGKVIIAANHSSYLDPVAIAAVVPRQIKWIVRKDVYDVWWLRPLFASTGMIRENGSVGKAIDLLGKGEALGVFPEGSRSYDGRLGAGRRGAAIMALRSGAPVVPCAVKGAFKAYPRNSVLPRPCPVEIIIGKAIEPGRMDEPDDRTVDSLLAGIMTAIQSLMGQ